MRDRLHGASSITFHRSFLYMVKVTVALLLLPKRRGPVGEEAR
jgi:hypothetical protein